MHTHELDYELEVAVLWSVWQPAQQLLLLLLLLMQLMRLPHTIVFREAVADSMRSKAKISITELACQHFTTPICARLPRKGCLGLGSRADLPSFGAHLLEARRGGDCARAPNLFASAVALAQSSLLGLLHWVNVSAASAAAHSRKRVVQCSSGSVVAMTSAKVCICLPCLVSDEKGKIIIKSPAIHC